MSFLWIDMLWLLLLVPVLIFAYIMILRRRQKYALRYSSLSLVKEALGRGPGIRRHIPPILFLIGITAMIIALARPVATVILPSQQGTVILTLDVSGSMRAEDMKPTRLEAATAAARTFM
jgi:Ca-activated chloride channel family protein